MSTNKFKILLLVLLFSNISLAVEVFEDDFDTAGADPDPAKWYANEVPPLFDGAVSGGRLKLSWDYPGGGDGASPYIYSGPIAKYGVDMDANQPQVWMWKTLNTTQNINTILTDIIFTQFGGPPSGIWNDIDQWNGHYFYVRFWQQRYNMRVYVGSAEGLFEWVYTGDFSITTEWKMTVSPQGMLTLQIDQGVGFVEIANIDMAYAAPWRNWSAYGWFYPSENNRKTIIKQSSNAGYPGNDPEASSVEIEYIRGQIGESCHSKGSYLPGDVNKDCYVNISDLAEILMEWLNCTDSDDIRCM